MAVVESLKNKIARKFNRSRQKSEVSTTGSTSIHHQQHEQQQQQHVFGISVRGLRSPIISQLRPSTSASAIHTKMKESISPILKSVHDHQLTPKNSRATVLQKVVASQSPPSPESLTAPTKLDQQQHHSHHPSTRTNTVEAKHDSTSSTDPATPPSADYDTIPFPHSNHDDSPQVSNDDTTAIPVKNLSSSNSDDPRRPELPRRQSLLPYQQTKLIKTPLETEIPPPSRAENLDYFTGNGPATISANMVSRKIWVRRPGASATLVTIHEGDLVDDVRDMILKKYANSLGRRFDSPDVTLRIVPREMRQERTLGPEEPMSRTIDAYFPGGQTIDEALIIDVPLRRTPKASPHNFYVHPEDARPGEAGTDYFPPMPVPNASSPHLPHPVNGVAHNQAGHVMPSHAISVLTTGHIPNLPSPGGRRPHPRERPRLGRQHTSSPNIIGGHVQTPSGAMPPINGTQFLSNHNRPGRPRTHSNASEQSQPAAAPLIPTPPPQETQRVSTPPPARVASPRTAYKRRTIKKKDHPSLPAGLLNGAVPPINVLIVEDNIINLKLLEAFMKRLKVRWQTAMNGREAVTKWRAGGFHLVLMDIQLPVMSGLEATREIRRLERLNSIGVFSSSASSSAPQRDANDEPEGQDKLPSTVLFKSPVIIVALTASSLQSDRHEALAAGCNDFLTKPVNFVWLERKVMEWGCMQALIDFDGWRKWKDFSAQAPSADEEAAKAAEKKRREERKKRNSVSPGGAISGPTTTTMTKRISEETLADDGGG